MSDVDDYWNINPEDMQAVMQERRAQILEDVKNKNPLLQRLVDGYSPYVPIGRSPGKVE